MASNGERVLSFAHLSLPADEYPEDFDFNPDDPNFPTSGLVFLGQISLLDPARPGQRRLRRVHPLRIIALEVSQGEGVQRARDVRDLLQCRMRGGVTYLQRPVLYRGRSLVEEARWSMLVLGVAFSHA